MFGDLVLSFLKWGAIGLLMIPLIVLKNKVLLKEEKQLPIKWIVVVYLFVVCLFVANDFYHIFDI